MMSRRPRLTLFEWVLYGGAAALFAGWIILAPYTCSVDEGTAVRVLEDAGYTDVELGDYAYFGCSDMFHREWSGKIGDRHVSGMVCCGILKDCTVRH